MNNKEEINLLDVIIDVLFLIMMFGSAILLLAL